MARRAADPYLPWLTVRVLIPHEDPRAHDRGARDLAGVAPALGRRHVGLLRWTPPPSLEQVAQMLRERVGQAIAKLSEVEMP